MPELNHVAEISSQSLVNECTACVSADPLALAVTVNLRLTEVTTAPAGRLLKSKRTNPRDGMFSWLKRPTIISTDDPLALAPLPSEIVVSASGLRFAVSANAA